MADYKLTDLLSTAGATIGIIIAAGILLSNLDTKYIAICERLHQLAEQYRGNQLSDPRRDNLRAELSCYRRQVSYLYYGILLVCGCLTSFLLAVADAGLSIILPKLVVLKAIGTVALVLGLILMSGAIALRLVETVVERQGIRKTVADLADHLPSLAEAIKR